MPEFQIPTRVRFGAGALMSLLPSKGPVLLVSSPAAPKGEIYKLSKQWADGGLEVVNLEKPPGEPSSDEIDKTFSALPSGLAAVAGVGGGSTLDFAKALALLAVSGGGIAQYEFGDRRIIGVLPLYLAPTTCGSGSEVTPYCVVTNSSTGRKFTLNHSGLRPAEAAIDPELLLTLPGHIRLSTALDAFIHCLEALLTRSDTRLIAPIAEAGLKIGWRSLSTAGGKEPTKDLVSDLAQMSLYGGLCISHSRTGLIHTLSVAFAEFVDLPHGLLNARLLPHALAHNLPGYHGFLAKVVGTITGEFMRSDEEAYNCLTGMLNDLIKGTPTFSASAIEFEDRRDHIVRRVLQDKGLAGVSHGVIDTGAVTSLIGSIIDASR